MNPNNFVKKNDNIYECELCHFYTSKKTNYTIHLDTKKHKNNEILQNPTDFVKKNDKFICECGKSYKHKPTLYAHKKNCIFKTNDDLFVYDENNINYKEMFLQILQKTDTLHNLLIEQNKIINEIIPKIGNSNNSNSNNINSNNNFNITLFLNEHCKDALSIDEFVKKIEISLTDLLFTKQKGLVNGISNIFIKNLNDLSEKERPIWCTDKKRKKIFIKDEEWTEDVDNTKTKQAIKDVSKVQIKSIQKYTQENPDWKEKENKKEEYITIIKNTTTDIVDKETEVINKLVETIYLDTELKKSLTN